MMNFIKIFYLMVFLSLIILGIVFVKEGGLVAINRKLNLQQENSDLLRTHYIERVSLFEIFPEKSDSIIFLGDSITEGNNWDELFGNENIINRGIDSDTTFGVLHRLKEITSRKPRAIFLMIGINDIAKNRNLIKSISNYEIILLTLKRDSPNTTIFIQSVLPVNESLTTCCKNSEIIEFNVNLKYLAKKYDIQYIDLYSLLSTNNSLLPNVTEDGIHLNGEGYNIWRDAIVDYVKILLIQSLSFPSEGNIPSVHGSR